MLQDYSGQNLRGRSFKGQNLAGANFSCADIRSADFTGANLVEANFQNAKAGLRGRWKLLLMYISWLLVGVSGFFTIFSSFLLSDIFSSSLDRQVLSWTILIILVIFFAFIICKGINESLAVKVAFSITIVFVINLIVKDSTSGTGILFVAIPLVGAIAAAFSAAIVIAVVEDEDLTFLIPSIMVISFAIARDGAFTKTVAFTVIFSFVSIYIAWRALKGDKKYTIIFDAAIAFAAFGGTSFHNADLTDADFTGARLKSTDFRKANLTRTCFQQVKMLDRVRPGISYLQHAHLRQVFITGQGQESNFDRLDLRGVNLRGAYLTDASFIAADLSNACFQEANLSRAKLVQTQIDGTNFTGSILTGPYIEDWNITHETNLTGVKCEYMYMRLPTKENPNPLRKPDNNQEVFADGDFGDFIQPIFDTLDLYHNQGVDPRAIAISFKQLAENNPDAKLRIVGMEVKGENKFLLRAKTTPTANKSEISGEYFDTYNHLKTLPEQ